MDRTTAGIPAGIGSDEAIALLMSSDDSLQELVRTAGAARDAHRGRKVSLCAILNARSGACPEDCAFCAQSAHSKARVEVFGLIDAREILEAALKAEQSGASRFSIVTSGKSVDAPGDVRSIAQALSMIRSRTRLMPCASLGIVSSGTLKILREAGLDRYHHNLETSRSFYPEVCTTRSWSESVGVIEAAAAEGVSTCCGGIFGLGESIAQRVELLDSIRELGPDSVPINFLNPIPGTKLEGASWLSPVDCVRIVAVARLMMPTREIRLCGGREVNLCELQVQALAAGADGLMIGGYLTTGGNPVEADMRMIREAGLE